MEQVTVRIEDYIPNYRNLLAGLTANKDKSIEEKQVIAGAMVYTFFIHIDSLNLAQLRNNLVRWEIIKNVAEALGLEIRQEKRRKTNDR